MAAKTARSWSESAASTTWGMARTSAPDDACGVSASRGADFGCTSGRGSSARVERPINKEAKRNASAADRTVPTAPSTSSYLAEGRLLLLCSVGRLCSQKGYRLDQFVNRRLVLAACLQQAGADRRTARNERIRRLAIELGEAGGQLG